MKRASTLFLALCSGLTAAASAQAPAPRVFEVGTEVVIVGRISSAPKNFLFTREKKMQVAVGQDQTDHTLHLGDADITGAGGAALKVGDLDHRMWVRAEGRTMEDSRRIQVSRLWVLGEDDGAYRSSAFFRPSHEHGFVMNLEGTRQVSESTKPLEKGTYVALTGVVSSQPRDVKVANEKKMQVAVGPGRTDYTLHMNDARLFHANGQEFALGDLRDKMWVRAEGKVMDDARRIDVLRLWVLGGDPASYQRSAFFRRGHEHGYVMPVPVSAVPGSDPLEPTTLVHKWAEGTPVALVGIVSSQPKKAGVATEPKMQVAIGPSKTDYTVHFSDAKLYGYHGEEVAKEHFRDKMWVRAEGVAMDDPRRIKVHRMQVIAGNDIGYRKTTFFKPGFDQGYIVRTIPAATAAAPPAQTPTERWAEGTPVVVVGEISSQPRDVAVATESKMQVAVGTERTDYTLHIGDAKLYSYHGTDVGKDHMKDKMWVRAEGTVMDDPRRIKVARLQVIGGNDIGYRKTAFYRPGYERGYVMAVAGTRQTFPAAQSTRFASGPVTLVGRVSDDTGGFESTRKIQVQSAGNEWTLNVSEDAGVVDAKGEKLSVHEVKEGQWVRATGWQTDDLRMRVTRLENIGASEVFEKSTFYRKADPLGYVERSADPFQPSTLSGTLVSVNRRAGYFVLRDDQGREQRIYADSADIRVGDRAVPFAEIKSGTKVNVVDYSVRPAP